jgi:lipopolysaccharide heptosyltransferase II
MNKIALLKSVDKVVGRLLVSLLGKNDNEQKPHVPMFGKILVIRPGGIGDAVLLLPAIQRLKSAFPDSVIDVLCEKRNAGVFELSEETGRLFLYDRDLELFRCLRNNYDVVIDTEQWHRLSAVVAFFTKAPVRIGFDTNERRKLFTHAVSYSHDSYEVYSFFHLIESIADIAPVFNPDEPFVRIREAIPSRLLPDTGREIIAVFPGASVAERRWGGEKYGLLAKALQDKGYQIVILGSTADSEEAARIKEIAPDCVDLTGMTSLREAAVILKHCRLLITADSGVMHIAYAVGTPTVSIFGSGIEEKWAPVGRNHIVLNKKLACSPCTRFGYTPQCMNNIECLESVSAEEVIKAAETILSLPLR